MAKKQFDTETSTIEMSVSNWITIPDNPRQRDTEGRAEYAKRKHLSKRAKIHDFVFAAAINGSIVCKLDGHTRAFLWKNGILDQPPNGRVIICLIEVENIREAMDLYDMADSKLATKTPSDVLFGAVRENSFRLKSPLLRKCTFTTQLKIATNGKKFGGRVLDLVKRWKPILLQLDSLGLSPRYSTLISVMLCSIKRDGLETAEKFWKALDENQGTKTSTGGKDGIEALNQHVEIRKAECRMAGWDNLTNLSGVAVSCYEAWKDGKRFKREVPSADFNDWIAPIQFPKKQSV
jgi:hypothetical protein